MAAQPDTARSSRRTTTVRPARHGNPGNERPVSSGADDVWQDLPPVTDAITPTFLAAGMGTLEQTESPIVDAIGRFVPPTTGIELRIDGFGWQRQPYGQA
jgi:hypothetical protein